MAVQPHAPEVPDCLLTADKALKLSWQTLPLTGCQGRKTCDSSSWLRMQEGHLLEKYEEEQDVPFFWFHSPREFCVRTLSLLPALCMCACTTKSFGPLGVHREHHCDSKV